MATVLQELSEAVSKVASRVGASVVGVGASGSGVVVGSGLVATNAHNLRGSEVTVTDAQGHRSVAAIAGADLEGDLALLSVDTGDAAPLEWSPSKPSLGEAVVAVAQPGGRGLRVSAGFVSAIEVSFRGPGGRRITGAVEHTAPLARGSSGGALVDSEGRLLGINTHREGDGFYLAVPADEELRKRIDGLAKGQVPYRPRLGVAITPPRVARRLRQSVGLPEREGLLVHAVDEDGPAGRGGVRQGDLIVSVAGEAVTSVDDLAAALERAGVEASVDLGLVRGVEELVVAVDLRRPATDDQGGSGDQDAG